MKLSEELLSWENAYKSINERERVKPIDTAGKAIAEILRLADENKQLKRDLEFMTQAKDGGLEIIERLQDEIKAERKRLKQESQDYIGLAVTTLIIWIGYIGFVING